MSALNAYIEGQVKTAVQKRVAEVGFRNCLGS